MTEAEWLACPWPRTMLTFLKERGARVREVYLFAVACCRRLEHLLPDRPFRQGLEVAEQFAEGKVNAAKVGATRRGVALALGSFLERQGCVPNGPTRAACAVEGVLNPFMPWHSARRVLSDLGGSRANGVMTVKEQADLVREVFGNPFRSPTLDPAWLAWNGRLIPKLAHAIHEQRAFDRMPILGDALEEAGCTDAAILEHCRGGGPHARGCWVVDIILAKDL